MQETRNPPKVVENNFCVSGGFEETKMLREVCIHIWSFLDFDTIQRKCTLVSRAWMEEIRNSPSLSREMKLRIEDQSIEEINDVLNHWKMLQVLHVTKEEAITQFGINLNELKLLRKIIVPKKKLVFEELGVWGKASKVWIDPKNLLAPAKLENIFSLRLKIDMVPENIEIEKIREALPNVEKLSISGDGFNLGLISSFEKLKYLKLITDQIPRDFEMEKIGQALPNVEELFVYCQEGENFNLELIMGFKSLKTLKIKVGDMDMNDFLDTLRSLENVKTLNLFVFIGMNGKRASGNQMSDKEYDEKYNFVQEVFQDAIKIIDENFRKDSTEFRIDDYGFDFVVRKYKGEAPERRDDLFYVIEELTDSDGHFDSISEIFETDDIDERLDLDFVL